MSRSRHCSAAAAWASSAVCAAAIFGGAARGAPLPPLGSPAARALPGIDSGVILPAGPDPRTLDFNHWVPFYPAHSPHTDPQAAAAVAAAGTTLPTWAGHVTSFGKNYNFTMVGASPLGKGAGTTNVPVVVLPLKFVFNNATFDATQPFPNCSPAGAATMVSQSPLVLKINFSANGTIIGQSQYIDLFQRANFWNYVKAGNQKYHTMFAFTQGPTVTVTVNGNATGATCSTGAGGAMASVDGPSFSTLVEKTLIPQLSKYVNPGVLPLFLSYDVVFGGALGYHNAYATKAGTQTFAVSAYMDLSGAPKDVSVLSHEMGEFLDDPLVNNPTPAWGHTGQVSACQSNLEVGDPLTGLSFGSVKMANGYTYTVQDLTFFSWFYRGSPSFAVNGQYTLLNYFHSVQPICH